VSAVGATTADGTYGVGDTVDVTIALDAAVTVDTSGGTPALVLDMDVTDRSATYSGGDRHDDADLQLYDPDRRQHDGPRLHQHVVGRPQQRDDPGHRR